MLKPGSGFKPGGAFAPSRHLSDLLITVPRALGVCGMVGFITLRVYSGYIDLLAVFNLKDNCGLDGVAVLIEAELTGHCGKVLG